MSAPIRVLNVKVLDNPAKFEDALKFEITFDCIPPGIQRELEWKLVYVGSADDEKYDQVLDTILVGPVAVGRSKFVFEAPAPDASKIPRKDLLEVTVLLLTCSYDNAEFIRIGYYVNNEIPGAQVDSDGEMIVPEHYTVDQVQRTILHDSPRITRFNIKWDAVENDLKEFMDANEEQQNNEEDTSKDDMDVDDEEEEDMDDDEGDDSEEDSFSE